MKALYCIIGMAGLLLWPACSKTNDDPVNENDNNNRFPSGYSPGLIFIKPVRCCQSK